MLCLALLLILLHNCIVNNVGLYNTGGDLTADVDEMVNDRLHHNY